MGNTACLCKLPPSTFAEDCSIIRASGCLSTISQVPFETTADIVLCFLFAATIADFHSADGTRHTCFCACCCAALSRFSFCLYPYACYLKRVFTRHCRPFISSGLTNIFVLRKKVSLSQSKAARAAEPVEILLLCLLLSRYFDDSAVVKWCNDVVEDDGRFIECARDGVEWERPRHWFGKAGLPNQLGLFTKNVTQAELLGIAQAAALYDGDGRTDMPTS